MRLLSGAFLVFIFWHCAEARQSMPEPSLPSGETISVAAEFRFPAAAAKVSPSD